ncbi:MAG: hypothetical protein ACK4PR_10995, partial [Gammaproteobacteria bacterium]
TNTALALATGYGCSTNYISLYNLSNDLGSYITSTVGEVAGVTIASGSGFFKWMMYFLGALSLFEMTRRASQISAVKWWWQSNRATKITAPLLSPLVIIGGFLSAICFANSTFKDNEHAPLPVIMLAMFFAVFFGAGLVNGINFAKDLSLVNHKFQGALDFNQKAQNAPFMFGSDLANKLDTQIPDSEIAKEVYVACKKQVDFLKNKQTAHTECQSRFLGYNSKASEEMKQYVRNTESTNVTAYDFSNNACD